MSIAGDGSATYIHTRRGFIREHNTTVVPFLKATNPDAKLIITVRNPADRFF